MSRISETRFYLSRHLPSNLREAAADEILAAGATIDDHLSAATGVIVCTPAEADLEIQGRVSLASVPVFMSFAHLSDCLRGPTAVAVRDGEELILDVHTGEIVVQFPEEVAAMPLIREEQVTPERLRHILEAAGIRTSLDDDGDILASIGRGVVHLLVADDNRMLRLIRPLQVNPRVSEDQILRLLAELNSTYDVIRWKQWGTGGVCVDYLLTFEHGLVPAHLVTMLTGFSQTLTLVLESERVRGVLGADG